MELEDASQRSKSLMMDLAAQTKSRKLKVDSMKRLMSGSLGSLAQTELSSEVNHARLVEKAHRKEV